MISTSKLSRLENAQGSPQPRDIRDLARFYGIEGTELAGRLLRWARAAQRQGWWTDYPDELVTNRGLDQHIAYESDATVARLYTIPVLPALLQTPEYTRAFYKSAEPWRSDEDLDALIAIRARRAQALHSRAAMPPLELVAVTHESSLRQRVGSSQVMRSQLDELIERSTDTNIQLYVLPFTATPTFTFTCMYAYFEYGDDIEQNVVQIETHAGFWNLEKDEDTRRYRRYHDGLVAASHTMEKTRSLIRSVRDEMT
jgi:hypothetical protein